uniref:Uncharacterized protein n=1 Tax=Triticum urartu TaxID=4572 RepID=A0A8R7UL34_TRIUA
FAADETIPARRFFRLWQPAAIAGTEAPCAILVVPAHWVTESPAVSVIRGNNDTIYNFPSPCTRWCRRPFSACYGLAPLRHPADSLRATD